MNRKTNFLLPLIFLFFAMNQVSAFQKETKATPSNNLDYKFFWNKIDSLENYGLPRSALVLVDNVYFLAKQESEVGQVIKSLIYKMKLNYAFEGDNYSRQIRFLEGELPNSDKQVAPLLHSMLGEMYWVYFQNNRYRFYNRSETVNFLPDDIQTWSLDIILDKARTHYMLSVEKGKEFKDSGLYDAFKDVLLKGKGFKTDEYSMFDFITYRVLEFLKSEETAIIRKEGGFNLNNKELFLPSAEFIKTVFLVADSTDHNFLSVKIYQEQLSWHFNRNENNEFARADLERLKFVYLKSTANNKIDLYIEALNKIKNQNLSNPLLWGEAAFLFAQAVYDRGLNYDSNKVEEYRMDFKSSRDFCLQILRKKNQVLEYTSKNAEALIALIDQKSMGITSEDVLIPGQPSPVLVSFRNLDSVYVRIVKTSYNEMDSVYASIQKTIEKINFISWEAAVVDTFKQYQAFKEQAFKLPQSDDYRQHSTEFILPALPAGQYMLLFSNNKSFSTSQNTVAFRFQPVSNISYIKRIAKNGDLEFCLLNRKTGKPWVGLKTVATFFKYNNRTRNEIQENKLKQITGPDGFIRIPAGNSNSIVWVDFKNKTDQLSTKNYSFPGERGDYLYNFKEEKQSAIQTVFFTDRAIYRPGQTVYFKGIVYKTDFNKDHKIQSRYSTKVEFYDANSQKIAERDVVTNEFGTFSGEFVIPQGVLNGQMSIREKNGNRFFSVEEYKRPKFEIVFQDTGKVYKLNENVKVTGLAKAFSGATIDGATVKFTVTRQAEFPYWRYRPYPNRGAVEITSGAIITNNKGEFEVSFEAIPDLSMKKESNPVFRFKIFADITDINGETHSSEKTISVGYQSLLINLKIPELVNKSESDIFKITSTNLEGTFQPAKGRLVVYRLKAPQKPYKSRLWETPDLSFYPEKEFHKLLPENEYKDENDFLKWEKGDKVFETGINTAELKSVVFKSLVNWNPGKYVVEIESSDPFGENVKSQAYFTLWSAQDKKTPYPNFDFFELLDKSVEPGGIARILVGSFANDVSALFELEQDGQLLESKRIPINSQLKVIEIPIKESYAGNVCFNYTFVRNGRLYNHTETINVPYSFKNLNIQFETFRDKLLPGENEEWRIKIAGNKGEKVAAEMVATLYDASLETFAQNAFDFNINRFWFPRLGWQNSTDNFRFKNFNSVTFNWNKNVDFYAPDPDRLNWFGFNYYFFPFFLINEVANEKLGSAIIISSQKSDKLQVTGTIRTIDKDLLPGATIVVKGTSIGTVADDQGKFNLEYNGKNAVLIISYVGYKTIFVGVEGITKLDVKLAEEQVGVDEVAVTGLGIQRKMMIRGVAKAEAAPVFAMAENVQNDASAIHISGTSSLEEIPSPPLTTLENIQARVNFNETAFFYPHLKTNENGEIIIGFKIPESLTRWKMLGFAHTQDLKYGFAENSLVTAKSLMVVPNLPRFFREGDQITITSKIVNVSEEILSGSSQLMLFDALTLKPSDKELGNTDGVRAFKVEEGKSTLVSWQIKIPVGIEAVTCKIVAQAGNFTDGEENTIPVLSNRMLVTETLPIWVRGGQTKEFMLDKLVNTTSDTRRNHSLTFEFTANPAWYAIQSLPYMMEYPYECMEQTFSRLYANSIATHIINSAPKIKRVFEAWKNENNGQAFLSKLVKNQELKQVLLQETPWVLDAKNESERSKRIALLFDLNKMADEKHRAIRKLKEGQYPSGAWPWFADGPESRYITQHIVSGFGHLQKLGVIDLENEKEVRQMVENAIQYLDGVMFDNFKKLKKDTISDYKIKNLLSCDIVHYLYARSFFKDIPIPENTIEAFHFYKSQVEKYWRIQSKYMQGMIALTLYREGNIVIPERIVKSLKEFATNSEELGMYWKEPWGYYWYQAPVETQALMVEVFNEVTNDKTTVDNLRVWLLKNKQVNDWKTTKATTEACYALLLGGADWLATENKVEFKIGNKPFDPNKEPDLKMEAGTGYFKKVWPGNEIKPEMGKVLVTKKDEGISWGGLYWQYFEQLDKITPAETPLQLTKKLFRETGTKTIEPIANNGHLKIGDKVVVRVELRVDRDMEFVHLKDMRAACFEPINVLSGYRYQDGIGYYETTKDASVNFFIDYLRKGTYVFEYRLWVTHEGQFSNGITTIQSMYAPEFSAHSEGIKVLVNP